MKMTEQELRQLDAEVAEKVMGKKVFHAASATGPDWWWSPTEQCVMRSAEEWDKSDHRSFKPTIQSSDAMEVLKKCADRSPRVEISSYGTAWVVGSNQVMEPSKAETLELAICLFAKALFETKPNEYTNKM